MLSKQIVQPAHRAASVFKQGLQIMATNPSWLAFTVAATVVYGVTFPIISATIFSNLYSHVFSTVDQVAPHKFASILGIVTFTVFYASLISAYFSCATAASVFAQLDSKPIPLFEGLKQVGRHFGRVTKFALLSVFLFPMGIYAQRRKLPRGILGVLGSSFTLHMPQMAPAILTTHKPMGATVRDTIGTLGESWREGLILKIGMYVVIFIIFVLPKLVQHGFFHGPTANTIGWLVSLELAASSYVIFKVIYSIFTSVLYYRAKNKK